MHFYSDKTNASSVYTDRCAVIFIGYWLITQKFLTLWWNNFIKQSPSGETNGQLASQEIPSILCNPKFHYRVK